MQQLDSRIALLIDADNAPASKIEAILSEIAKYGVVNIRESLWELEKSRLKKLGRLPARVRNPSRAAV